METAANRHQTTTADQFDTGRGVLSKTNPYFTVNRAHEFGRLGTFRFKQHVKRNDAQWVDAYSKQYGHVSLNVGDPNEVHGVQIPRYFLIPCDVEDDEIVEHLSIRGARSMSKRKAAEKKATKAAKSIKMKMTGPAIAEQLANAGKVVPTKAPKARMPKAEEPKPKADPNTDRRKTKAPKQPKPPKADGQMSGLDAVAKVLASAGKPMSSQEMVDAAFANGWWKSEGKTPAATIYAAIIREIAKKGEAARFKKVDKGTFEATGA